MKEGDIILSKFQTSDGSIKRRPAVVLREMPPYGDYLLCGISSQLYHEVPGFDMVIEPDSKNRLKVASLVRLGYLTGISPKLVSGRIGELSFEQHQELLSRLSKYLAEKL